MAIKTTRGEKKCRRYCRRENHAGHAADEAAGNQQKPRHISGRRRTQIAIFLSVPHWQSARIKGFLPATRATMPIKTKLNQQGETPMAKCPSCKRILTNINFKSATVHEPYTIGKDWRGIIYYCPMCSYALSVGIDPVSLKADTVSEVSDEIATLKLRINQLADLLNEVSHRLNQMH
jgi:hypothetical protein